MIDVAGRFMRELFDIQRTADNGTSYAYFLAIIVNLPIIIQRRSLNPADKEMTGRYCVFRPFEKNIKIDGEYFALAREIYCQKCYFTPPGFSISPNDIVVDLGANVGVFTVLAALHARKVIAIEAQSGFIQEIERRLEENNCLHKVYIEHALIGTRSGVFSDKEKLTTASHYGMEPPEISFSDIMTRHQIKEIDFLKVDIEGSEFDMFNGDTSWLARTDKIAMEIHLEFGDMSSMLEILEKYSFKVWLVNRNQQIVSHLKNSIGYLFAKKC